MIQQQVQLNGSLGPAKFRLVKQGDGQINDRGIDAGHFVFKPELLLPGHLALAAVQQLQED